MKAFSIYILLLFCLFQVKIISAQTAVNEVRETYFLAIAAYEKLDHDKALFYLSKFPDNKSYCSFKARIFYENKKYSEAISEYKRLINYDSSVAHFALAQIYAEMGFEKESMLYLEKHFQSKDPKSYPEIISTDAFYSINRSEAWREFWQTKRYTANQELYAEATYLISQNRSTEAINLLYSARTSANKEKIHHLLAKAFLSIKSYSNALKNIDLAIERNKRNTELLELRLEINMISGNDADALSDIRELVRLNELNPNYLLLKAKLENNNRNFKLADSDLSFYLRYFPDNTEALYYSATVKMNLEEYWDALKLYNVLLESDQSQSLYFEGRGDVYYALKDYKFATSDYTMALDINPRQADIYYKLGWCRFYLNDKDAACHSWKHALRLKHRDAVKVVSSHCR